MLLAVPLGAGRVAADDPTAPATAGPAVEAPSESRSVGAANRGTLSDATRVPDHPAIRIRNERGRFGTRELVEAIVRAAEHVEREHPGSPLYVGDLSRERGGRFGTHSSHQSGRDADLGFYLLDGRRRPARLNRWPDVDAMGRAELDERRYRFDVERNWALISALVTDPTIVVQYVFAMFPVRQILIRHAEEIGAPEELIAKVRAVMRPDHGNEHRSHFHVRIYCPPAHRPECTDEPPFHDFYQGEPPAEEVLDELARRRRIERRRSAAGAATP